MSTKQHQALVDAQDNLNKAVERMMIARREWATLIRETGTALRKHMTPAFKDSLMAIATKKSPEGSQMYVSVTWKGSKVDSDLESITRYLGDHGWKVGPARPNAGGRHVAYSFFCS